MHQKPIRHEPGSSIFWFIFAFPVLFAILIIAILIMSAALSWIQTFDRVPFRKSNSSIRWIDISQISSSTETVSTFLSPCIFNTEIHVIFHCGIFAWNIINSFIASVREILSRSANPKAENTIDDSKVYHFRVARISPVTSFIGTP